MSTVIALVVVLVLAVAVLAESLGLLLRWTHPMRVLSSALSCAFILLLLSLAIPMIGLALILWCALLGLTVLGVVVASVRVLRSDPPLLPGGDAQRRQRRRARRAAHPSWAQVVVNAVLFLVAAVAALVAG